MDQLRLVNFGLLQYVLVAIRVMLYGFLCYIRVYMFLRSWCIISRHP